MSYLRGIAKAIVVYSATMIAIGCAFGLQLLALMVGMRLGWFSEQTSGAGNFWMATLCLLLPLLVVLQGCLPRSIRDALCLHQLNSDGTPAGAEQLVVRCMLLVAYVILAVTLTSSFPVLYAPELLPLTYFAILAPAVQLTLCRGQFSLIDYVLFASACSPQLGEPARQRREVLVTLSLLIAASLAFVLASLTRDVETIARLSSFRNSNPGLFDAVLNWSNDPKLRNERSSAKDDVSDQRVSVWLAGSGTRLLYSRRLGAARIEEKDGEGTVPVDDLLEVQLVLPSFWSDQTKLVFQQAANRICSGDADVRSAGRSLGLSIHSYGRLDSFEYEIRKHFLCVSGSPAKEMSGMIRMDFAFSAASPRER